MVSNDFQLVNLWSDYSFPVTFDETSQGQLAMVIYEWNDNQMLGKVTSLDDDSLPVSINLPIGSPTRWRALLTTLFSRKHTCVHLMPSVVVSATPAIWESSSSTCLRASLSTRLVFGRPDLVSAQTTTQTQRKIPHHPAMTPCRLESSPFAKTRNPVLTFYGTTNPFVIQSVKQDTIALVRRPLPLKYTFCWISE